MLDKCKTTGDQLASLSSLQSLEHLNLSHCLQITDEGMLSVGRMANLKKLDLTDTKISDDGLKYLKGLEHLEMIILANTRVTDAGVRQLKRTKLEGIELQGCRGVTIKTLQFLISDFPNLKQLSIFDTAIKPSDYYLIGKLKDLNFLVVVNTPLDKRTLQAIGGLTKLSELSIADNSLTDDDLLYFSNLHDLKNLYAKSQKFTKPGQMKLSDRLEKCRIISEFGLQRVLPGFDDFYFEPLHP